MLAVESEALAMSEWGSGIGDRDGHTVDVYEEESIEASGSMESGEARKKAMKS